MNVLSYRDVEGRYCLPEPIQAWVGDKITNFKNAPRFLAVFVYLCRAHGLRPLSAFPLDRRAIFADFVAMVDDVRIIAERDEYDRVVRVHFVERGFDISAEGIRTVIAQMLKLHIVEVHPNYTQGRQIGSSGSVREKPVIYRFGVWIRRLLRAAIALRKPSSSSPISDEVLVQKDKAQALRATPNPSVFSGEKAAEAPVAFAERVPYEPRALHQTVPRISQLQAPAEDDPRLANALRRLNEAQVAVEKKKTDPLPIIDHDPRQKPGWLNDKLDRLNAEIAAFTAARRAKGEES